MLAYEQRFVQCGLTAALLSNKSGLKITGVETCKTSFRTRIGGLFRANLGDKVRWFDICWQGIGMEGAADDVFWDSISLLTDRKLKPVCFAPLLKASASDSMSDARGGFDGFCGETRCPPTTVQL
jgi:hypothetical protein